LLRAHNHTCVDYVGPWLPEPIQTTPPGADGELAASLTTAFLLMLERLTPKERAAYLLREIFDQPYPVIAATLEMEEAACRKLVSRARTHIDQGKIRHVTLPGRRRCAAARGHAILAATSRTENPPPPGKQKVGFLKCLRCADCSTPAMDRQGMLGRAAWLRSIDATPYL
jgi:hypothetical protein